MADDERQSQRGGTLYVVATPIGNLTDTTSRMVETLRSVDRVVAEDTRRSRALLTHFGISKPLTKLDANSSELAIQSIVEELQAGSDVAVVTDAGTPSVSDPGARLVRLAAASAIRVTAIPGPSAVTTAIAVSGLVEGPFLFLGFLPRKGEKRRRSLARIAASEEPVVLFESPNRVVETLAELARLLPDRSGCVARELTKLHEEVYRGTLSELASKELLSRGEFTIVLGAGETDTGDAPTQADELDPEITKRLSRGETAKTISLALAAATGLPRRAIYQRAVALSRSVSHS